MKPRSKICSRCRGCKGWTCRDCGVQCCEHMCKSKVGREATCGNCSRKPYVRKQHVRKQHVCNDLCDHYRTDLEKSLSDAVNGLIQSRLPNGTRAKVEAGLTYLDIRVVCGGAVPITCHYCCLKPGHSGLCFSVEKGFSEFAPDPLTKGE